MITQIPQSVLIVPLLLLHPVPDVLLRAAPMRDYTGFDSLLSPLFCLVVMVSVWALQRCMPGRDILFFIPKSWRDTQPLYQLGDDQALAETRAYMMMPDTGNKDPAAAPAGFEGDSSSVASTGNELALSDGGVKTGSGAGRRPMRADDSAHAGRQQSASKAKNPSAGAHVHTIKLYVDVQCNYQHVLPVTAALSVLLQWPLVWDDSLKKGVGVGVGHQPPSRRPQTTLPLLAGTSRKTKKQLASLLEPPSANCKVHVIIMHAL
jgi:hypothetical protein